MAGFKSQAKHKRQLAKLDKRRAKDVKRALRKAERTGQGLPAAQPAVVAQPAPVAAAPKPPPSYGGGVAPGSGARPPLTLAEAVQRWKNTKVVNAKPAGKAFRRG